MLLYQARTASKNALLDEDLVSYILRHNWIPMLNGSTFSGADLSMFLSSAGVLFRH